MSDSISRRAALAEIDRAREGLLALKMDGAEHILVHYGRRIIEELPSDEKYGKWQFRYADVTRRELIYECSECGCQYPKYKYCPHCGARMDVKGEEK